MWKQSERPPPNFWITNTAFEELWTDTAFEELSKKYQIPESHKMLNFSRSFFRSIVGGMRPIYAKLSSEWSFSLFSWCPGLFSWHSILFS